MLVLMWVLNSTAVAAIQFCLLNDFVNQSHISQLEHITDKTGFSTSSIVTEVQRSIRLACLEHCFKKYW